MKRVKKEQDQYDEIMEPSENQQQYLAKILTTIFNDQYIFTEKSFRNLLEDNPQGYIHVDKLLKYKLIDIFFKQSRIQSKQQQICMLRTAIESHCPQLYYHLGRVRRLNPFDLERYKQIKPICLQRITEDLTISDVRSYFGQHVFTSNRSTFIKKDQDALIYSLNYRQNMQSILQKNPPFQILDYQAYYKQYDLSFRLRQRKHRTLCKPLEAPKRRFQEFDRRKSRKNNIIDDQYDNFREQRGYDYQIEQKNSLEQFHKIGRQPNLEFNKLLKGIWKEKIQYEN